jgi:hypothetical protein
MDEGRTVFTGHPDHLRQAGTVYDAGDSEIERGYTALLRLHRTDRSRDSR